MTTLIKNLYIAKFIICYEHALNTAGSKIIQLSCYKMFVLEIEIRIMHEVVSLIQENLL